jgi:long-chain acyl-CoA synthetase
MLHIVAFLDAFMGLSAGARVIIPRSFDPDGLLEMFEKHSPTVFMTLPSILFALVRDSRTSRDHLQSLRLCSAGGDKVSTELEREFNALTGQSVNEQYGMSEVGIASINPPEGHNKIGSMGRAIEGYQFSVRAADDSEQSPNTEGRLWIKSPGNMIGYWESPEATAVTIKDGWLDTGDIVRIDPDGYVWFCGRQKQMIIHDGSNIIPQEVEDALLAHPAVEMAGVVGVPDLLHGENVQAYVTLKESFPMVTPDELIAFARNRVGYKAPQVIVVLDRMPLNASEKVDRAALRKLIGLTS